MDINIITQTQQYVTTQDIDNLAFLILAHNGNIHLTNNPVSLIAPENMNPDTAGVVVKASNGNIHIDGASDISDEVWNDVLNFGVPKWITDNAPIESWAGILTLYSRYPQLKKHIELTSAYLPNITDIWMLRSYLNYTNWDSLDNIMSITDWRYLKGGFYFNESPIPNYPIYNTASRSNTIVNFFGIGTDIPKLSMAHGSYVTVSINGNRVYSATRQIAEVKTFELDLAPYIKTNNINYIAIGYTGYIGAYLSVD